MTATSRHLFWLQVTDPMSPSDDTEPNTAIADLLARVHAARILREHHVWEAVRLLSDAGSLPEDFRHCPELHRLMEKGAFGSALRLIAQTLKREFSDVFRQRDRWVATLVSNDISNPSPSLGRHRDRPAAMLTALLLGTDSE